MTQGRKQQFRKLLQKLHLLTSWVLLILMIAFGWPGVALAISVTGNGDTFHGVGAETNPHYSYYTNSTNTFALAAHAAAANATINWSLIEASPTEDLLIGGTLSSAAANNLTIQQSDGNNTSWAIQWQDLDANYTYQGFDIAFEDSTGDALVVYADGTAVPKYRTYSGGPPKTWSGENSIAVTRTTGVIRWIKLETNPGTDTIGLVYQTAETSGSNLNSLIWGGGAWGNEPGAGNAFGLAASNAYDDFDMGWEAGNNALVAVYGRSAVTFLYYSRFAAGAWAGPTQIATSVGVAQYHVRVAGDPESSSNCIVVASMDNQSTTPDLHLSRWNGASWSVKADYNTTTHSLNSDHADITFAGTTHQAVVVYPSPAAGATLVLSKANLTSSCNVDFSLASGGASPTLGAGAVIITAYSDPSSSNAMFLVMEETAAGDLSAFKYTYNAAPALNAIAEATGSPITTDTSTVTTQCFAFAYERLNLVPTLGEILFLMMIGCAVFLGVKSNVIKFKLPLSPRKPDQPDPNNLKNEIKDISPRHQALPRQRREQPRRSIDGLSLRDKNNQT